MIQTKCKYYSYEGSFKNVCGYSIISIEALLKMNYNLPHFISPFPKNDDDDDENDDKDDSSDYSDDDSKEPKSKVKVSEGPLLTPLSPLSTHETPLHLPWQNTGEYKIRAMDRVYPMLLVWLMVNIMV